MSRLLSKVKELDGWDVNLVKEILEEFEENSWVKPTNLGGSGDAFAVLDQLAERNLACKMIIPRYVEGQFVGKAVEFLYNHDLKYK